MVGSLNLKLFVKMRFEPKALLPSDRHCRSVLEGLCREKWGKWLCLDPTGEGSEAPLRFLLFPVGGAAAVLREGGVPVGQRAEDSGCGRNWSLGDSPNSKCKEADARRRAWTRAREGQIPRKQDHLPLGTSGRERRRRGALVLPEGDWAMVALQTEPEFTGSEVVVGGSEAHPLGYLFCTSSP